MSPTSIDTPYTITIGLNCVSVFLRILKKSVSMTLKIVSFQKKEGRSVYAIIMQHATRLDIWGFTFTLKGNSLYFYDEQKSRFQP